MPLNKFYFCFQVALVSFSGCCVASEYLEIDLSVEAV